jgi:hypothetical protein
MFWQKCTEGSRTRKGCRFAQKRRVEKKRKEKDPQRSRVHVPLHVEGGEGENECGKYERMVTDVCVSHARGCVFFFFQNLNFHFSAKKFLPFSSFVR